MEETLGLLRRVERAHRCISRCNRLIIRGLAEEELLQQMCRLAVEEAGFRLAWVGYAVHDEARTVRPVAQFGYEAGYLESVRIDWTDDEGGRGPTGTAIRTGLAVMARDIQTDPHFVQWREQALARGYAASVALPLLEGDRCFGALNLYAAEPDAFDAAEMELLDEMALDLAHGIHHARGQARLSTLDEALARADRMDAVGRVAAGIAHDVNNMLMVISMATESLSEALSGAPDSRSDLQQIEGALARATALNADLLRLGSPATSLVEPIDADECLRALWALLSQSIKLEARVSFDAGAAGVRVRSADLERLFTNLVVNAGDAMPRGGVLAVRTAIRQLDYPMPAEFSTLRPGAYVALVVEDTGIGMSESVLHRACEPYFTTKGARGNGLGLATVFSIARRAGGAIAITSKPGHGTRVEVLLPAVKLEPNAAASHG